MPQRNIESPSWIECSQNATSASLPLATSSPVAVALTPEARLMWLAYTNRGRLVTGDTSGELASQPWT